MVERFFSSTGSSSGESLLSERDSGNSTILLSGPPSCGKTSLLFQFALNCLASSYSDDVNISSRNVVFICSRQRLQSNPPYLSQGIDPSSHNFHRIQIKYVEDDQGVNNYFAAFHLHHSFPVAVIIDDFGGFFHQRTCQERYGNARGRDLAMVRTLALCQNSMLHANKRASCKLLLSDTHHGDSPGNLFIYKRWVSSIFTIKGDNSGVFLLKSSIYEKGAGLVKTRIAKYSMALQYLVLEGITECFESS
ncbi:hypothetical protein Ancab_020422 [Ancistrocladus abbreviatus]